VLLFYVQKLFDRGQSNNTVHFPKLFETLHFLVSTGRAASDPSRVNDTRRHVISDTGAFEAPAECGSVKNVAGWKCRQK
jgi:hypothetical protein